MACTGLGGWRGFPEVPDGTTTAEEHVVTLSPSRIKLVWFASLLISVTCTEGKAGMRWGWEGERSFPTKSTNFRLAILPW